LKQKWEERKKKDCFYYLQQLCASRVWQDAESRRLACFTVGWRGESNAVLVRKKVHSMTIYK